MSRGKPRLFFYTKRVSFTLLPYTFAKTLNQMSNRIQTTLFALVIIALIPSCRTNNDEWKNADVSHFLKPNVVIQRYETDLFQIPLHQLAEGLADLAPKYPLFIGENYNSEQALIQMRDYLSDPAIKEGYEAVERTFVDVTGCEKELGKAFQRMQAVVPGFRIPEVYSYISGFDTQTGVFVNDSVVIIPLDLFLGNDFAGYKKLGIPAYLQQNMEPGQVVPEVIRQIIHFYFWTDASQQPLIDQMVLSGKLLALAEFVLPEYPVWQLIGYSQAQYNWCRAHETNIWAMMIEKQMLFTTNQAMIRSVMNDGPFTPGLDKNSPGRIGEWVGYQIVRSYLKNHKHALPAQLFKLPGGQSLLQESGYKPRSGK